MDTATVEKTKEVWFGTLTGCPFQNVTIGTQTFALFTENVEHPSGALITKRSKKPGMVLTMGDDEIAKIKTLLDRMKLRKNGEKRHTIIDPQAKTRNPLMGYRPMAGDRDLAEFVYFIETSEAVGLLGASWMAKTPPSYAEMRKAKPKQGQKD